MAPGKYVVMIAPVWNESAFSDPRHTEVYVELLSTLEFEIGEISAHDGNRLFEFAMIQHARDSPDKKQISNLQGTYRVISLEVENMWFGYIYSHNDSERRIQEDLVPTLGGTETYLRSLNEDGKLQNVLESNGGHSITILRRTAPDCTFSLSSSLRY